MSRGVATPTGRRAGHGPRDAGHTRRASSPSTPPSGAAPPHPRAPRRAGRPLPGHRRDLAADRADPGPGGRAGRGPRRPRHPGGSSCATGPSTSDPPSRRAWPNWPRAGVGRVVGIVLTPHQSSLGSGEYFRRAEAGGGIGRLRRSSSPPWPRGTGPTGFARAPGRPDRGLPGLTAPSRPAAGRPCSSPPTASPSGWWPRVTPTPTRWPSRPPTSPGCSAWTPRPGLTLGGGLAERGRTADPWIGPDLLAEIRRVATEGATAGGGVPGRVRLRPPRGPLRPRHRGRPGGPVARGGLRPDPVAQRRPPLPRHPGRRGPRGRGRRPTARSRARTPAGMTAPARPA